MQLFHSVELYQLEPGDHVYRWTSPLHSHHGVIKSIGKCPASTILFEFNTPDGSMKIQRAQIQMTTLQNFTCNGKFTLRRAVYGASGIEFILKRAGTTYTRQKDSTTDIIRRAERALMSDVSYHPLFYNCESFAVWCCTGIAQSMQADAIIENSTNAVVKSVGTLANFGTTTFLKTADDVAINASGVGAAVLVEAALFAYRLGKYRNNQMTGSELAAKTSESIFVAVTTTIGGLVGSLLIPVPVLGTFLGAAIGTAAGKLVAYVVKKMIEKYRPLTTEEITSRMLKIAQKRKSIEIGDAGNTSLIVVQ